MMTVLLACTLVAVDGDTLKCGKERIRLLAIDAPEMPGHCRRGRQCVRGDPYAAKESLQRRLRGTAEINRVGHDHYGRTLAWVRVNGIDLSCHQLKTGQAAYRPQWDRGRHAAHCMR